MEWEELDIGTLRSDRTLQSSDVTISRRCWYYTDDLCLCI